MRAARWLAFVFAAPLASPQDAPALASIQGQVIDAATGAPVRKASITLRQPRKDIATATSDASGAFVFPQAVPGEYRLIVRARGYLTLTRDTAIRPLHSGTAFSAAAGQKLTGLVLRLTPGAALSGRIADEDDDPVAGVLVQLWSITYRRGRRELSANPDARATTDERGIFRIGGVAPGRHFLSATYPDTPQEAFRYVRTFYPGTLDPAAAAPLDLTPGADLENINVKISKVQTVRVAGRVLSTVPSNVLLYPEGVISSNDAVTFKEVPADGAFEFDGVAPGSYILHVNTREGLQGATAIRGIQVGPGGVSALAIRPNPPIAVAGRVRLEGEDSIDFSRLRVMLSPLLQDHATYRFASVAANGALRFDSLPAARHALEVTGIPAGFYLQSVRLGNRDLTGPRVLDFTSGATEPIELRLSAKAARVAGVVYLRGTETPVPEATVVLVPDDAALRDDLGAYPRAVTDESGRFALPSVVPGGYRAFAWEAVSDNIYMDPAFTRAAESSSVAVAAGESSQVEIKLDLIPASMR